jgi:hypothetical protein
MKEPATVKRLTWVLLWLHDTRTMRLHRMAMHAPLACTVAQRSPLRRRG